jgi:hypothetical protein
MTLWWPDRPLVAWDTEFEVHSEFVQAPPLTCVSWATGTNPDESGLFHHSDERLHAWLADLFATKISVGLRLAQDVAVVLARFPDLFPLAFQAYAEGRMLDVRLGHKLHDISEGRHEHPSLTIDASGPYSMAAIVWRHFKERLGKDNPYRLQYGLLRHVPLEGWPVGAVNYPIDDALWTLRAFRIMVEKYGASACGDLGRQGAHAFALKLVQCHGMRTDVELVARIKAQARATHDRLRDSVLVPAGLVRVEQLPRGRGIKFVKTRPAIVDRIVRAAAVTGIAPGVTKTGVDKRKAGETIDPLKYVTTDAEACDDYSAALAGMGLLEDAAILDAYSEFNSLGTRLTTQFPYLERGQIHPNFESLRETTRTSCGGGEFGYNTQNQPVGDKNAVVLGERECCVPRPGFVFGDNDYGGLELCSGAQMNLDVRGFSKMADVINSGKNAHTDFGATLVGINYDEASRRKKTNDAAFLGTYAAAKQSNFGFGGGMGPTRFQATCKKEGIILPIARCKELHKAWPARWTEFGLHFNWASSLTGTFKEPRPARIKFLRVERWRGGLFYGECCNTLFQALGADVAKDALFEVVRAMYDWTRGSVLFGSRVVNFVHDQILSEFPEVIAHECALEQTRIMNEVSARWLPGCPAKTEPTLARRFSKTAGPVYDKPGGRLIPWEHPSIVKERTTC